MHKSLTIAGSDSSGGAGIQADLKTMTALGVYGMSVITALTAQNTTGVQSIFEVTPKFLVEELDSIFTDIFPDSVKIGMVSNADLIRVISKKLREYNAKNIVVDPVMVSTSGSKLMDDKALETLLSELFKVADIITPNIPEAEALTGQSIKSKDDMVEAAKKIGEFFEGYILLKGGHSTDDADDLLYKNSEKIWIKGERIENPNTHGTGCTLSSAIASYLAMGHDVSESVHLAKEFITGAISAKLDLGKGRGPLNHMWKIYSENM